MWIDMLSRAMSKFDFCLSFKENTSDVSYLRLDRVFIIGYEAHEETSNTIAHLCVDHYTYLRGNFLRESTTGW